MEKQSGQHPGNAKVLACRNKRTVAMISTYDMVFGKQTQDKSQRLLSTWQVTIKYQMVQMYVME
jgi:hypothetical protein